MGKIPELTKEQVYDYINIKGYYAVSDVILALKYEDFKELPFGFLQYMLYVQAPEAGNIPTGESMEDLTVNSIYNEFSKEEYYGKLEVFLNEFILGLTEECLKVRTVDYKQATTLAVDMIRGIRAIIYRNYIGIENPSKLVNKYMKQFNEGYAEGVGTLTEKDEKFLFYVSYFYDNVYNSDEVSYESWSS